MEGKLFHVSKILHCSRRMGFSELPPRIKENRLRSMKDLWFYQLNELSKCSRDDLGKVYQDHEFILILKESMQRLTKDVYMFDPNSLEDVIQTIDKLFVLKKMYSRNLEEAIIASGEAAERNNYDKAIQIMNCFMSHCESSFYYELANEWMTQLREMKSNSIT